MRVIGTTTHHEVTLVTRERAFHINELLIIEDPVNGPVRVEIAETQSQNPLLPEGQRGTGLLDETTLATLRSMGFDPSSETLYVAVARVMEELPTPLTVGAAARVPTFDEVKDLLLPKYPERSLLLGVIRGTEKLYDTLPEELKEVAPLLNPKSKTLMKQNCVPFYFDVESMDQYPHIGIFGGSGSGKSFALRVLLEELMAKELPTLVFDPHYELEFSQPAPGINPAYQQNLRDKYRVFELGRDVGIRFEDLSTNELAGLLRAAMSDWTENMDQVARKVHERGDSVTTYGQRLKDILFIITRRNWDSDPSLSDADRNRLEKIAERYGNAGFNENTVSAVIRRFGLLENSGLFRGNIEAIRESLLAGKTAVIRGPVKTLNLFAVYTIRHFFTLRRRFRDSVTQTGSAGDSDYFPPFFIVFDEAHNLVPKPSENDHVPARPIIREIAQEGRKYGVFLIPATQRPALLDDTVNAQLNTKIILRTVRAQDIDTIQKETDLRGSETARLPYLTSGNAFVSSAITGRTVPVRIRAAWTQSPHAVSPFEEWRQRKKAAGEDLWKIVEQFLPLDDAALMHCLMECERSLNRKVSQAELETALRRWTDEGRLKVKRSPFGSRYIRAEKE